MSNLNTILNKLGKIEEIYETNLGKHEIELNTIQNIINYVVKSEDIISKFEKLEDEFEPAEKKILALRKQMNAYKQEAKIATDVLQGELEKLEKQSKEIGVDLNTIPAFKEGKKSYAYISVISKTIDEYNKPI
jgi:hypothetical protein